MNSLLLVPTVDPKSSTRLTGQLLTTLPWLALCNLKSDSGMSFVAWAQGLWSFLWLIIVSVERHLLSRQAELLPTFRWGQKRNKSVICSHVGFRLVTFVLSSELVSFQKQQLINPRMHKWLDPTLFHKWVKNDMYKNQCVYMPFLCVCVCVCDFD